MSDQPQYLLQTQRPDGTWMTSSGYEKNPKTIATRLALRQARDPRRNHRIATTSPTFRPGNDPAYYAGRVDAYDDHRGGTTPDNLTVRLGYLIDHHPNTPYVLGYADRVLEIHAENRAITTNDTYWETAA